MRNLQYDPAMQVVSLEDILSELDASMQSRGNEFKAMISAGHMSREQALEKYEALKQAKAIVQKYYSRLLEDLPYAKTEITQELTRSNPAVGVFIKQFNLKHD